MEKNIRKRIKPQRDPWLDNIKALLIIIVVVNHFLATITFHNPVLNIIYTVCNYFEMPCFMILTGYLSQSRINSRNYHKMLTRLFVPYLSAQFLVWAVCALVPHMLEQLSKGQSVNILVWLLPNYHLWYIFGIFVFNLITPMLLDIYKEHGFLLWLTAMAASVLIGYAPEVFYVRLTKLIAYYPLFLVGYLCSKSVFLLLRDKLYMKFLSFLIWAIWLPFCAINHQKVYRNVLQMATPYTVYPEQFQGIYPPLMRILLLVISIFLSFGFMSLVSSSKRFYSYVGRNSLYVYILHGILVLGLRTCNDYVFPVYQSINTVPRQIAYIAASIILAFLLASRPVVSLFRHLFEPQIKIPGSGRSSQ